MPRASQNINAELFILHLLPIELPPPARPGERDYHKSKRHHDAKPSGGQTGQGRIAHFGRRHQIQNSPQERDAVGQRIQANQPCQPIISARRECPGQQPHRQQKHHHDGVIALRRLHLPGDRRPSDVSATATINKSITASGTVTNVSDTFMRESQQQKHRGVGQSNQRAAEHFAGTIDQRGIGATSTDCKKPSRRSSMIEIVAKIAVNSRISTSVPGKK